METQQEQFGPRLVEQLREQVSNLMAASQLLTPAIREQPERRYDQYLAILNQSLYRLLRLMNSVECAQRMERDGAQALFRPEVLDLAGLCRELGAQVTPLAERAGVAFRCEADRDTLLTTGDGALLQEMLLHLISNALRAAGPGGEAGKSAYQCAREGGYTGAEADFHAQLAQVSQKQNRPLFCTALLSPENWTAQGERWRQTVPVQGATQDCWVTAAPGAGEEDLSRAARWGVFCCGQGAGVLTFEARLGRPSLGLNYLIKLEEV